ncbi:NepR family anti-sigma factor [Yoonia sp. 2307UL14-13]|uniref:NepR family anti-sigma factor n=1 Tax=Yoonia sp. 2307UL14-13 TaxID=3126506 RepID=UPI0030AB5BE2
MSALAFTMRRLHHAVRRQKHTGRHMRQNVQQTTTHDIDHQLRQIFGRTVDAGIPDRLHTLIDHLKEEEDRLHLAKSA